MALCFLVRVNVGINELLMKAPLSLKNLVGPLIGIRYIRNLYIVSNDDFKEADNEFTPEVFDDTYLNMELALPSGDGAQPAFARVTKRLRDANGLPIGTAHDNPILDSRMYEVEYQDGHKSAMATNAITQNFFAQVDAEGNYHVLFDEIIDHRTDGKEVKQQDAFLTTRSGTQRRRETTIGWDPSAMERPKHFVDRAQRYEGFFSSSAGRVFCTRKNFPRACVCLVGVVRSQEAKPNYC